MSLTVETTTTLLLLIQAYYEKTFLDNLKKEVVFLDYAKKYSIPRGFGPVINFSRYTRMAANTTALSEGTVPTTNVSLTDEQVSATVAQYGDFALIGDFIHGTHISGPNEFVNQAVVELAYRAKLTLDALVRNAMCASASAVYKYPATSGVSAIANLVGSTHTMAAADIRVAVKTLKTADVKPYDADSYVGIIGPGQLYDLQGETATGAWLDANKYTTPETIAKGEIGKLYGARIVVSNNLSVLSAAANSGTISDCPFFGRESVAAVDLFEVSKVDKKMEHINLFIKEEGSAGTSDPLNQLMTVGYKFNFVAKRLNDSSVSILRVGQTP